MAREKLTDPYVRSVECPPDMAQLDIYDTLTTGLLLRVGRGGLRTWMIRYRLHGTHRRMKIGVYPIMKLVEARETAKEKLVAAARGEDPAQEKADARTGATTFRAMYEEVLEEWTRDGGKKGAFRGRTLQERIRIAERFLYPAWGSREAATIRRRDVQKLLDGIKDRGTVAMARSVLLVVSCAFNTAIKRDFPGVEANPAHLLSMPKNPARERFLEKHELRAIWQATDPENAIYRGIFRMVILTAQRIGSVKRLRWADVDEAARVWVIPEKDFKSKRRHMVPLSAEALEVLAEMRALKIPSEYVFPATSAWPRHFKFAGTLAQKNAHHESLDNALNRLREASGFPDWRPHDLRRTLRTWGTRDPEEGGLGLRAEAIDQVLGHTENTVGWQHYQGDKSRYMLAEKRDVLVRWGAWVRDVVEADGDDVQTCNVANANVA